MKNILSSLLFTVLLLLLLPESTLAQKGKKGKKGKDKTEKPVEKKKKPPVNGDPKPYKEVITDKAVSQNGLMITHKIGDKFFFELPVDLLEKEIMVVSRISG